MSAKTDRTESMAAATGLGKAIAIRRVELGLSRNDLRDRSGLSYPYVAELEKGVKSPSSKALEAIARALETRPHQLLAMAEELASSGAGSVAHPSAEWERRRWFASFPDASRRAYLQPSAADRSSPVTARRSRGAAAGEPLTEERVRAIVREELRQLIAEAAQ